MKHHELAEALKCPETSLAYLKSILDGTEAYFPPEDEQDALALETQLLALEPEEETSDRSSSV